MTGPDHAGVNGPPGDLEAAIAQVQAEAEQRVAELRAATAPVPVETSAGPQYPDVDDLQAQQDARDVEDFDAFWQQQGGGKVLRNVCGRDLQLPRALPLRFEIEARRLATRTDAAAVLYMFGLLFGEGVYADLVTRGLDAAQFPVLLAWGSANASGVDMTLAQAQVEVARMERESAAGKAPAPPGSGGPSSGTGRRSRPTSPGSTGRRKRRSQR